MAETGNLLFDTNCLIDIFKGRERIRPFFNRILIREITPFLSVMTEAELWRGLRVGELEQHQILVSQFTRLPLRSDAARLAGIWMQRHQQSGLGWMDAFITASAKVNNITILTRDKRLVQVLAAEADFTIYD